MISLDYFRYDILGLDEKMLPRYLSIASLLLELFMLFKVASGSLLSKSGITFAFQMINALYLGSW